MAGAGADHVAYLGIQEGPVHCVVGPMRYGYGHLGPLAAERGP